MQYHSRIFKFDFQPLTTTAGFCIKLSGTSRGHDRRHAADSGQHRSSKARMTIIPRWSKPPRQCPVPKRRRATRSRNVTRSGCAPARSVSLPSGGGNTNALTLPIPPFLVEKLPGRLGSIELPCGDLVLSFRSPAAMLNGATFVSRQPLSPDAPRGTKSGPHQTDAKRPGEGAALPRAAEPSKPEACKTDAAFEVTESPAPGSDRASKPPPHRKPGPPPGLVAQLLLGFAVLAAAAGTYLVLKLPKAAPTQSEAVHPPPAATGNGVEPSRERPPR